MDRTEFAWAAGFWDGEGSAYLSGSDDRATKQPHARINQASTTGVPEVLLRFQRVTEIGAIAGPVLEVGREPLYRWTASSRRDVEAVYRLLAPWLAGTKRTQFEEVLTTTERAEVIDFKEIPGDEQLAWVAGFWDGEGSVCLLKHRSHVGHFVPEASVTQSSGTGRPEVLFRVESVARGGHWYGPFVQERSQLPVYRWKLFRYDEIRALFERFWPWLGSVKRDQALAVFAVLNAQPVLPRGNPAWGSHKTHCIRGHEYTAVRLRTFKGRGKNTQAPRASHQCLACVRAAARAKRQRAEQKSDG